MSMYKEFEKEPEPLKCYWCEEKIKDKAIVNNDLYDAFGYIYCSEDCYQSHIRSK